MPDLLLPLRFLLLVFAGLVNREQARAIEFLREENRVLRERLCALAFASMTANAAVSPRRVHRSDAACLQPSRRS